MMVEQEGKASGTAGQMDLGSCQAMLYWRRAFGVGIRQVEGGAKDHPK